MHATIINIHFIITYRIQPNINQFMELEYI